MRRDDISDCSGGICTADDFGDGSGLQPLCNKRVYLYIG